MKLYELKRLVPRFLLKQDFWVGTAVAILIWVICFGTKEIPKGQSDKEKSTRVQKTKTVQSHIVVTPDNKIPYHWKYQFVIHLEEYEKVSEAGIPPLLPPR